MMAEWACWNAKKSWFKKSQYTEIDGRGRGMYGYFWRWSYTTKQVFIFWNGNHSMAYNLLLVVSEKTNECVHSRWKNNCLHLYHREEGICFPPFFFPPPLRMYICMSACVLGLWTPPWTLISLSSASYKGGLTYDMPSSWKQQCGLRKQQEVCHTRSTCSLTTASEHKHVLFLQNLPRFRPMFCYPK